MLTAAQVMTLKAKIKAEMLRRSAHGSVAAYGGANYDFTKNPEPEAVIQAEHGQKTVDLLLQIAPHNGLVPVESEQTIQPEFDAELLSYVDTLAAQNMTGASSCAAACTGLCVSTCTTACQGCSGTCSGTCQGCSSTCTGSCSGCSNTCTGTCSGCFGSCVGSCYGCTGCGGQCSYNCSGCSGSCSGTCSGCSGSVPAPALAVPALAPEAAPAVV